VNKFAAICTVIIGIIMIAVTNTILAATGVPDFILLFPPVLIGAPLSLAALITWFRE
jgi:hypothetical protein